MELLLGVAWVVTGGVAYGIALGAHRWETERAAPYLGPEWKRRDLLFSVFLGLLGPVGLVVAFLASGFARHGLRWKP